MLDGSYADYIRIAIINNLFKKNNFKNGIDIACGEGFLLNKLNFIQSKTGIDISKEAINRAKEKYPNIKFYNGNPFLDFKIDGKFEFISCFEGIYYVPTTQERKNALKILYEMGTKKSTYAFSVVTNGSSNESDYFDKKFFLDLLSENYNVLKVVNLTGEYNLPIHLTIIQKILCIINRKFAASLFFKFMQNTQQDKRYQELFICKQK